MKRVFILCLLTFIFVNTFYGQSKYEFVSKSVNERIKLLPKINSNNIICELSKKNGKPFAKVELYCEGRKYGISNEFGKYSGRINKSGKLNFKFVKGGKSAGTTINFSKDSIYTFTILLHKPDESNIKIKTTPLDKLIFDNISKEDNNLLSVFMLRFPKSSFNKKIVNIIDKNIYNTARETNDISDIQKYIYAFPNGEYISSVKQQYDEIFWQEAVTNNTISSYKNYIENSPYKYKKTDAENRAWVIAQRADDKSTYWQFRNNFPNSKYISSADKGIENINRRNAIAEEDRVYNKAKNSSAISDCENYLSRYPKGRYVSEVESIKNKTLENKELAAYLTAHKGDKSYCDAYLSEYPNGAYKDKVNERILYLSIKNDDKIASYDKYLTSYPSGEYADDINNKKNNLQAKLDRKQKIKENSNVNNWQLGYKVCHQDYRGVIMGGIEQFNTDKSRVQIKIAASPGGLTKEGDKLTKGNTIWINPKKGWHLCLDDEKEYAMNHDKSDDFEKYMVQQKTQNTKKGKFEVGASVKYHISYGGLWRAFVSTGTDVRGIVTNWNSSFTKMEVKITDAGNYDGTINGQSIYTGAKIWVSPYGWK